MFYRNSAGERYRILVKGENGSWVISFDNPSPPKYVDKDEIDNGKRIEPPAEYILNSQKQLSQAAINRLELIKELLDDDRCITDATARREMANELASKYKTSRRRIIKLYFIYLATGGILQNKHKVTKKNQVFDKAIKKYYFTAKRNSLKTCYELMVLESFTDTNGDVKDNVHSFDAFRQYYYRNWSTSNQKSISRNGLTQYQRNERPLRASAMAYRDAIGSYQIDETLGDIYLVSQYDRKKVIGRPNIYLAVDTVSGMITGLYVGFDSGETAAMRCIANSAIEKSGYCKTFGISIENKDWPSLGLPSEIITDRGKEFIGQRLEELCVRYGIIINSTPPFRAELKPIVERVIGLVQDSYRSCLEGKGIIRKDAMERWAKDYRDQAVLTIDEYTRIVIICICTLNKSRILQSIDHLPYGAPNTPLALWNWFADLGKTTLLEVDINELYIRSLPRASTKVTRRGILFNKLRYVSNSTESIDMNKTVTFAYDPQDMRQIYVIKAGGIFEKYLLSESFGRYKNCSAEEIKVLKEEEKLERKRAIDSELAIKVEMRRKILEIVDEATEEANGNV